MLDRTTHRQHIVTLLLKIYGHPFLGSALGFKGGTAAYLFYDLPRFSVDLDFDILPVLVEKKESFSQIIQTMTELIEPHYQIADKNEKHNTLFWLLSYEKGKTRIKIEISTRKFANTYEPRSFYGVTIPVMKLGDMMAHKLVAIQDRKVPANRDLFDAHFFLKSPDATKINYRLVKERTGLEPHEFYESLLKHLEVREKQPKVNVLDGLGELLTDSQKDWARAKLMRELIELVKLQRDSFSHKSHS